MPSLLIVDDEANILKSLEGALGREGYAVETAASVEEARRRLREAFDLVLLDVRFPGASGLDLLSEITRGAPETVAPGATGEVVDGRDRGQVAAAVAGLLGDRDKARAWGAAGRARVPKMATVKTTPSFPGTGRYSGRLCSNIDVRTSNLSPMNSNDGWKRCNRRSCRRSL